MTDELNSYLDALIKEFGLDNIQKALNKKSAARPTNKIKVESKPEWLTVQDARARYGLSSNTIYRLMAEEKIKSTMVRGRRLLSVASLDELMTSGEEQP